MIKVENGRIEVSIAKTPLTELFAKVDMKVVEKAAVQSDLTYLWMGLIEEFGKNETAGIIQESLNEAIKIIDNKAYHCEDLSENWHGGSENG